jgi:hypothetical protein
VERTWQALAAKSITAGSNRRMREKCVTRPRSGQTGSGRGARFMAQSPIQGRCSPCC